MVFSAFNCPHNKFLQTPLYESNCLKQITKLLIRRSRKKKKLNPIMTVVPVWEHHVCCFVKPPKHLVFGSNTTYLVVFGSKYYTF